MPRIVVVFNVKVLQIEIMFLLTFLLTCYFEPSSDYELIYLHVYVLYLNFALLPILCIYIESV